MNTTLTTKQRIILPLLIAIMLISQTSVVIAKPAHAPNALVGTIVAISGVIALAAVIGHQLNSTVDNIENGLTNVVGTSEEAALRILEGLESRIKELTSILEEKYQDNMAITIESLNELQKTVFRQLEGLLETAQKELDKITDKVQAATLEVLADLDYKLSSQIADLKRNLEELIIVAVGGGRYLVDYITDRIIMLLAIGALLVVLFWLWRDSDIRQSLSRKIIVVTLLVLITLLLWPQSRYRLLAFAGPSYAKEVKDGKQDEYEYNPSILSTKPEAIEFGKTTDLLLYGNELSIRGVLTPVVTIDGQKMDIKADYKLISVDVTNFQVDPGYSDIAIDYPGQSVRATNKIIAVSPKPLQIDLELRTLRLSSDHGVEDANIVATLEICKISGSAPSGSFEVEWQSEPTIQPEVRNVSYEQLTPCVEVTFNHTYVQPGSYQTRASINTTEQNTGNNHATTTITIDPAPTPPPALIIEPWDGSTIIGPFGGTWGTWRGWELCPEGQAAHTFEKKVEKDGGDDTALNGIRLHCSTPTDRARVTSVESFSQIWGNWTTSDMCSTDNYIVGARLKIERRQGNGDDTGAVDVEFRCQDGQIRTASQQLGWGDWKPWQSCPVNTVICGIQTKVERNLGPRKDDTALNDAQFACCTIGSSN